MEMVNLARVLVVLAIAFWVCLGVLCLDEKRDWRDPYDMLNYDSSTKRMKQSVQMQEKVLQKSEVRSNEMVTSVEFLYDNMQSDCCQKIKEYEIKYKTCLMEKANDSDRCKAILDNNLIETVFIQRFVAKLLEYLTYQSAEPIQKYLVTIRLGKDKQDLLERFVNLNNVHLQDIDEIISELFVDSYPTTADGQYAVNSWITHWSKVNLWVIGFFTMAAIFYSFFYLSYSKLIIFVFLIGSVWHWKHMYDEAVSNRHAEATKQSDLPDACRPQQMDWKQSLSYWWQVEIMKQEDACNKHYRLLMVDPFWEISPTMAMSKTFVAFFTSPLGFLATNIGQFFAKLNAELPPLMMWYVLPFLLVIVLCLLCMGCNYRFRGFGWAIEPVHNYVELPPQQRQMIQDLHGGAVEQNQISVEQSKEPLVGSSTSKISTDKLPIDQKATREEKTVPKKMISKFTIVDCVDVQGRLSFDAEEKLDHETKLKNVSCTEEK